MPGPRAGAIAEMPFQFAFLADLFTFQDGLDTPCRMQDTDDFDPVGNGSVEDQIVPESSDRRATKSLEARANNVVRCTDPGSASQRRECGLGGESKPPRGLGITVADVRISSD
jgi:hypothetical protein